MNLRDNFIIKTAAARSARDWIPVGSVLGCRAEKGELINGDNGEIKVKSLQKALEILNCFAVKQPLGVTEISEKLGLYKSNVHNILVTFTAMEYLVQDPESGKFRLGPEVRAEPGIS